MKSVTGAWRFFGARTVGDDLVVLEVADAVDSRGNIWQEAAWRVTVNGEDAVTLIGLVAQHVEV